MKAIVTKANGHDSIVMISQNNPDSASIMLRTEILGVNDQGFLTTEKRVGLFKGKTEDIQRLAAGLKEGDDFSAKITPVKFVVKEKFEPFYSGQEPKINPQTKEVVTSSGAPVYRYTFVVSESSPETDVRLATDRAEATAAMPTNGEFSEKSKR